MITEVAVGLIWDVVVLEVDLVTVMVVVEDAAVVVLGTAVATLVLVVNSSINSPQVTAVG